MWRIGEKFDSVPKMSKLGGNYEERPMKYLFIVNPAAGNGRGARILPVVKRAVARLDAAVVATERPGHATQLAEEAAEDTKIVVAVGGDGTVHEVARGLLRRERPAALGVLPEGTGNDFVRLLKISRKIGTGIHQIMRGAPMEIDTGLVRWREEPAAPWWEEPFVNAVGIGLDAAIADAAPQYKALPNWTGYLMAIPKAVRAWPSPHVVVGSGADFRYEGRFYLCTVSNGVSSGGGFRLAPDACLTDGELDLCFVEKLPLPRLLRAIPMVLRGTHAGVRGVHVRRTDRVHLRSDKRLPIHVDGEVLTRAALEVEVTIRPRSLTVLAAGEQEEVADVDRVDYTHDRGDGSASAP